MKTKATLTILLLSLMVAPTAFGQAVDRAEEKPIVKTRAPASIPPSSSKTHYVRKPHTKIVQNKPLFKYPNPHPAYIVTFTEEDMKQFAHPAGAPKTLERAAFAHHAPIGLDDEIDSISSN